MLAAHLMYRSSNSISNWSYWSQPDVDDPSPRRKRRYMKGNNNGRAILDDSTVISAVDFNDWLQNTTDTVGRKRLVILLIFTKLQKNHRLWCRYSWDVDAECIYIANTCFEIYNTSRRLLIFLNPDPYSIRRELAFGQSSFPSLLGTDMVNQQEGLLLASTPDKCLGAQHQLRR